jgi:hypothetical protein
MGESAAQTAVTALDVEMPYNNAVVAADSPISVTYNGDSWFGAAANVAKLVLNNHSLGVLSISLSKLAASAVGTSDKVMTITGVVTENIETKGGKDQTLAASLVFNAVNVTASNRSAVSTVSPNPLRSGDVLHITSAAALRSIAVYNSLGQLVAAQNSANNIVLTAAETGVYIVVFTTIDNVVSTEKVLILR